MNILMKSGYALSTHCILVCFMCGLQCKFSFLNTVEIHQRIVLCTLCYYVCQKLHIISCFILWAIEKFIIVMVLPAS